MFWANTSPRPDASTDLGEMLPWIVCTFRMRNCPDGRRGAGACSATTAPPGAGDALSGDDPPPRTARTTPQEAMNAAHNPSAQSARPCTILPAPDFSTPRWYRRGSPIAVTVGLRSLWLQMSPGPTPDDAVWPALPADAWTDTRTTVHLWTQIVGKIRMANTPVVNHWWSVTLYVTTTGLTTSPMPHGDRMFQIDFDFQDHRLRISTNDGEERSLKLEARSVADFYDELMAHLDELGLTTRIWTMPVEVPGLDTPFEEDADHASYDP